MLCNVNDIRAVVGDIFPIFTAYVLGISNLVECDDTRKSKKKGKLSILYGSAK